MSFFKKYFTKYNNIENKITDKIVQIYEKSKYLIKPFLILIIVFAIAYYPIFRANFNYLDDWQRVYTGYRGWESASRFISSFLSIFIHTSPTLTDISPLTQIIAIIFLSFSGVILLYLFKKEKILITSIVSCLLIGLNPYFLECISYKFDSPYMALSILSSVFPFIFYNANKKSNLLFALINFVCTLIMCMTYQASSGIIPLLTLFLSFNYWNVKNNKDAIRILIISAISYLLGLFVFKIFFMTPIDTYVSTSIFSFDKLIPGFISNLKIYYSYVKADFRFVWLLLLLFIVLCFIIKMVKESKQHKGIAIIIIFVFLILSFSLAFGVYPAFEKPIFSPRGMYGFGILITLICLNTVNVKNWYLPKIFVLGLCYCLFCFSFTYGNALSEQNRYVNFRLESVLNGLNEVDIMKNKENKTIKFMNNVGQSPVIENMKEDYKKLMDRLINENAVTFGSTMWTYHQFKFYIKNNKVTVNNTIKIPKDKFEVEKDTMYYKIESNGKDFILITLK